MDQSPDASSALESAITQNRSMKQQMDAMERVLRRHGLWNEYVSEVASQSSPEHSRDSLTIPATNETLDLRVPQFFKKEQAASEVKSIQPNISQANLRFNSFHTQRLKKTQSTDVNMKAQQDESLASLPQSRVASSFFFSPAGRERNNPSTIVNSASMDKKLIKTKNASLALTDRVAGRKTGMESMNLQALKEVDPQNEDEFDSEREQQFKSLFDDQSTYGNAQSIVWTNMQHHQRSAVANQAPMQREKTSVSRMSPGRGRQDGSKESPLFEYSGASQRETLMKSRNLAAQSHELVKDGPQEVYTAAATLSPGKSRRKDMTLQHNRISSIYPKTFRESQNSITSAGGQIMNSLLSEEVSDGAPDKPSPPRRIHDNAGTGSKTALERSTNSSQMQAILHRSFLSAEKSVGGSKLPETTNRQGYSFQKRLESQTPPPGDHQRSKPFKRGSASQKSELLDFSDEQNELDEDELQLVRGDSGTLHGIQNENSSVSDFPKMQPSPSRHSKLGASQQRQLPFQIQPHASLNQSYTPQVTRPSGRPTMTTVGRNGATTLMSTQSLQATVKRNSPDKMSKALPERRSPLIQNSKKLQYSVQRAKINLSAQKTGLNMTSRSGGVQEGRRVSIRRNTTQVDGSAKKNMFKNSKNSFSSLLDKSNEARGGLFEQQLARNEFDGDENVRESIVEPIHAQAVLSHSKNGVSASSPPGSGEQVKQKNELKQNQQDVTSPGIHRVPNVTPGSNRVTSVRKLNMKADAKMKDSDVFFCEPEVEDQYKLRADSDVQSNTSADFLSKDVRCSDEFSPRNLEMLQVGNGDEPAARITVSTNGGQSNNNGRSSNFDNMKSQKYLLMSSIEASKVPDELFIAKKSTAQYQSTGLQLFSSPQKRKTTAPILRMSQKKNNTSAVAPERNEVKPGSRSGVLELPAPAYGQIDLSGVAQKRKTDPGQHIRLKNNRSNAASPSNDIVGSQVKGSSSGESAVLQDLQQSIVGSQFLKNVPGTSSEASITAKNTGETFGKCASKGLGAYGGRLQHSMSIPHKAVGHKGIPLLYAGGNDLNSRSLKGSKVDSLNFVQRGLAHSIGPAATFGKLYNHRKLATTLPQKEVTVSNTEVGTFGRDPRDDLSSELSRADETEQQRGPSFSQQMKDTELEHLDKLKEDLLHGVNLHSIESRTEFEDSQLINSQGIVLGAAFKMQQRAFIESNLVSAEEARKNTLAVESEGRHQSQEEEMDVNEMFEQIVDDKHDNHIEMVDGNHEQEVQQRFSTNNRSSNLEKIQQDFLKLNHQGATKGFSFQATIKHRENIEADEDEMVLVNADSSGAGDINDAFMATGEIHMESSRTGAMRPADLAIGSASQSHRSRSSNFVPSIHQSFANKLFASKLNQSTITVNQQLDSESGQLADVPPVMKTPTTQAANHGRRLAWPSAKASDSESRHNLKMVNQTYFEKSNEINFDRTLERDLAGNDKGDWVDLKDKSHVPTSASIANQTQQKPPLTPVKSNKKFTLAYPRAMQESIDSSKSPMKTYQAGKFNKPDKAVHHNKSKSQSIVELANRTSHSNIMRNAGDSHDEYPAEYDEEDEMDRRAEAEASGYGMPSGAAALGYGSKNTLMTIEQSLVLSQGGDEFGGGRRAMSPSIQARHEELRMKAQREKQLNDKRIQVVLAAALLDFEEAPLAGEGHRIFEQIYVVGANPDSLARSRQSSFVDNESGEPRFLREALPPATLFQYPDVSSMKQVQARASSVPQFAFPNGILFFEEIDTTSEEHVELAERILYAAQRNKQNSFVFTLAAQAAVKGADNENFTKFNCLCVKYQSVQRMGGQSFFADQALCMITTNDLLPLHFKLIDKLLDYVQKQSRFEVGGEPGGLFGAIDVPRCLCSEVLTSALDQLFDITLSRDYLMVNQQPTESVTICPDNQPQSLLQLSLRVELPPRTLHMHSPLEMHLPTMLRCLPKVQYADERMYGNDDPVTALMTLLTLTLLERSIVVISEDTHRLTSTVVALLELVRPFSWQFIQIPLLPESLLDRMDAPVPIMAGITYTTFSKLACGYDLGDEFLKAYTWVYLDQREISEEEGAEAGLVVQNPRIVYSQEKDFEQLMAWFSEPDSLVYDQVQVLGDHLRRWLATFDKTTTERHSSLLHEDTKDVDVDEDDLSDEQRSYFYTILRCLANIMREGVIQPVIKKEFDRKPTEKQYRTAWQGGDRMSQAQKRKEPNHAAFLNGLSDTQLAQEFLENYRDIKVAQ